MSTHTRPKKKSSESTGIVVMIVFTMLMLSANNFIISSFYKQFKSQSYPQTQGTITRSEVLTSQERVTQQGHTRSTLRTYYRPRIEYKYSVDGQMYESSQYQYLPFAGTLDNQPASDIVKRFPEGQEVTVYYAKNNPKESVLITGNTGQAYLFFMFLLPFDCMAIIGWICVINGMKSKKVGGQWEQAGVRYTENGTIIKMAFKKKSTLFVSGIALCVSSIPLTLLTAALFGFNPPTLVPQLMLVIIFGSGIGFYAWMKIKHARYTNELTIDRKNRVLQYDGPKQLKIIEFSKMKEISAFNNNVAICYQSRHEDNDSFVLRNLRDNAGAVRLRDYLGQMTGATILNEENMIFTVES